MKVVIIEDETLLAAELEQLILTLRPEWQIVKFLPSVQEALNYFPKTDQYDLIFSDIQLGDGLSFEIFQQCSIQTPVIFCTAYNQYALAAIKNHGIDYILKPFDSAAILEAIQRFEALRSRFSYLPVGAAAPAMDFSVLLAELSNPKPNKPANGLLVRYKDKIIPLSAENIALCYMRNGLVYLLDTEQNAYPASETMDELETKLGSSFYRVDRQHLVNRNAIKDVSQHLARKLALNLKINFSELLLIRKEKTSDFLAWLSSRG